MKITNPPPEPLHPELEKLLKRLRDERGFNVEAYVAKKMEVIENYFHVYGLDAAVVGVSGGLDSAVVVSILEKVRRERGAIKNVTPVLMPVDDEGATGQTDATRRAEELCGKLGLKPALVDLSDAFRETRKAVERGLSLEGDGWARGQLVSYQRTPALYYCTSVLASRGFKPVVCGTTNRDEGAYLGYFGKASDGMVDLQIISDIHKSEVRAVAEFLDVPESILKVAPSGDMFDGRVDEEVFGAPYDFVELDHMLRLAGEPPRLSAEAHKQFERLRLNLENMHRYNGHKYLGRSPAVHLDVMSAEIENGWNYTTWRKDE